MVQNELNLVLSISFVPLYIFVFNLNYSTLAGLRRWRNLRIKTTKESLSTTALCKCSQKFKICIVDARITPNPFAHKNSYWWVKKNENIVWSNLSYCWCKWESCFTNFQCMTLTVLSSALMLVHDKLVDNGYTCIYNDI